MNIRFGFKETKGLNEYFILIGLFFLSACHIDGKLFNLNEKTIKQSIKKIKTSNIALPNTDFKK